MTRILALKMNKWETWCSNPDPYALFPQSELGLRGRPNFYFELIWSNLHCYNNLLTNDAAYANYMGRT